MNTLDGDLLHFNIAGRFFSVRRGLNFSHGVI